MSMSKETWFLNREFQDVPWDELDDGIIDTVRLLRANGIETIASCDGHLDGSPWVICRETPTEYTAETLISAGSTGFTVSQEHQYISASHILRYTVIHFWSRDCLPTLGIARCR